MSLSVRPCQACGLLPKQPGKHRCYWCILKTKSIVEQVESAKARRTTALLTNPSGRAVPKREWPEGWRWCSGCLSLVPLSYCRKSSTRCRACASEAQHRTRQSRVYGMSPKEYDDLLAFQKGVCAICGDRPKRKRLATDHNHLTLAVRGILCERCNHDLLSAGKHDPVILRRAAEYLEDPPVQRMKRAREAGPVPTPHP